MVFIRIIAIIKITDIAIIEDTMDIKPQAIKEIKSLIILKMLLIKTMVIEIMAVSSIRIIIQIRIFIK